MALDASALGKKTDPLELTYRWQDVALYALGVGAKGQRELPFLYEAHGPKVLPTFAMVPTFPAMERALGLVGGDFRGVVHAGQKLTVHAPFAPEGTLRTVTTVSGVYDLKRMAIANFTTETHDAKGTLLCETEYSLVYRFDGGFGGTPPPKTEKVPPPDREADFRVEEATSPDQALLYRLNGDPNPLHADPDLAKEVGFDRPILHGLCTYGYVGRAVLREAAGGDPARLRGLHGQFRKPVFPGETVVTEGWREGDRVILRASVAERPGETVFGNAWAALA